MLKITNIKWNVTDGAEETTPEEDAETLASLPKEVCIETSDIDPADYDVKAPYTREDILKNDELCEEISDYLSDEYGFCHAGFDVEVPKEQTYVITVTDTATYAIRTDNPEIAKETAMDWFNERKPSVNVEIDDSEEPETTL